MSFASAQSGNLALQAKASASEFYQDLTPEKGVDGNFGTRWSGIPGHNSGVWYQLEWDHPVEIAEVLVRQYSRFTFEWDVQVWDNGSWRTVRHFGKDQVRLPLNVLCSFDQPVTTTKLRIANITNGPSFNEVEVYAKANVHPDVIEVASDLRGNLVGIVCDALGASPVVGKSVLVNVNGQPIHVTSDDHGMFFVPLPPKLSGFVTVKAEGIAPRGFNVANFQRAVTPIDVDQTPTLLDHGWRFMADPPPGFEKPSFDDSKWPPIKVPAHWEMEGFRSLDGVGGYRLKFKAPPGKGRLMLRFDGVYSGSTVWLNGKLVALHEGGFTPFEADISDLVRAGDNVLALEVREHTNVSDNLDKMSQYADFPLAGIIRKVTLFRVPDVHVEGYDLSSHFSADHKQVTVSGKIRVVNRGARDLADVQVASRIYGVGALSRDWSMSSHIDRLAANGTAETEFALVVPAVAAWTAETPNLCTFQVDLASDGKQLSSLRQRIGLRETTIRGSEILINGSPVKIRGTCHHDQHPLMGRAVTPELTKLDLQMIKEANLNSVRTSHYPPIPELVQDADEMGLYVEDEADFCWVGVSDDLRNTPRILQLTGELIARDRNHPSVFMWSLCNESEFGYAFERSHEWVRKVDPSRPTAAATSAWLEIATLHNPIAINRIKENEHLDKPLLFDEAWCIYQGIFGDVAEMWVDPGMRDYYAEPLPGIWTEFMKSKVTQGSQIWAWSDDLFCVPGRGLEYGRGTTQSHFVDAQYTMPGRGIVGDAPWGVVDGWRRRKPEFWITKKLQSPVKVTGYSYDENGALILQIRNEYDFLNLSSLTFEWRSGRQHGICRCSIAARSEGRLLVPVDGADDPVDVTIVDSEHAAVDRYRFKAYMFEVDLTESERKPDLLIRDQSVLAGNSTHIIGRDFELAFDKDSGYLRRCVYKNHPLLLEFPSIHILPTSSPEREMPLRTEWQLESMAVERLDHNVVVTLHGRYPDLEGFYEYTITPRGKIDVHSKFTYTGKPLLAREIGLRFSVPRSCDLLSWNRAAEWNAYPDDHIGRPVGTARAFSTAKQTVPPTAPWSQDNSPMGSNDFRSTKRHIFDASIAYPKGAGVSIMSNGKQSLRAIVDTDRITVHVSDWFGGTNVGWGEWITNYGRGKEIKPGDILESRCDLLLAGTVRHAK